MAVSKKQIYDDVAGDYDVIWSTPAVRILFTLLSRELERLGDWTDKRVLDLACGTGIGLRLARKFGATKLVGVDISSEMIAVCRLTTKDVDMFELYVADCSQPLDNLGGSLQAGQGSFDLVIGMWLLNYAESSAQMTAFWTNIAKYLKPGTGKFVGIIQNQETVKPKSMETFKYGARECNVTNLENGDGVKMHVEFDTIPKVEFDTYVLRKEIFERSAKDAGVNIEKYTCPDKNVLSHEDLEEHPEEWWEELIAEWPNQLVVASRF